MSAPEDSFRPGNTPRLGEILVERNLISEEQLAYALAESKQTGEPTGEVIVRLGFATAATIAQALATQHGRPLKSEFGYAVGFGPSAAAPVPAAPPPISPKPETAAAPQPLRVAVRNDNAAPTPAYDTGVPTAPVLVPAPTLTPVAPAAELAVATQPAAPGPAAAPAADAAASEARIQDLTGDLEASRRETRTIAAERSALTNELQAATARIDELESAQAEQANTREQIDAAREDAARAETEKAELAARAATLEQRITELEATAEKVVELESALAAGRGELEESLTVSREQAARLAEDSAQLAERNAVLAERNAALTASNVELGEKLVTQDEAIARSEAGTARIAQLEAELGRASARISELASRDPDTTEAEDANVEEDSHLLFVAGRDGYQLVEREGPAPASGERVDLPGGDGDTVRLVVRRVGRSPLPGTRARCAYLAEA